MYDIERKLFDLCSLQDDVTRYNEKGREFVRETRACIERRNALIAEIVALFEKPEAEG